MALTDEFRILAANNILGDDKLFLQKISFDDALSTMFTLEAEFGSKEPIIDIQKLLGSNMTVRLTRPDGDERYFNGFVTEIEEMNTWDRIGSFRVLIRPWMWFLTQTSNCRIFQMKTVPEIIKQVFGDAGHTDVDDRLVQSYRQWEYCVQYRETDYNFVCRLMEQEGIYFYFTHENGKHMLVLADDPNSHECAAGYEDIVFHPPDEDTEDEEFITDWDVTTRVETTSYTTTDFDFKIPKHSLESRATIVSENSAPELAIFDYPGEYDQISDGETYAKVRLAAMWVDQQIVSATSGARQISVGHQFTLKEHPQAATNKKYLILAATCYATNPSHISGQGGESSSYSCSFTTVDAQIHIRPQRKTPKPIIQGPQTAIVVGKKGEEIWTDEYGRVKVKFHWDRYSKADENSSCWIRVSQSWAGKKWGAICLPRIGQEVIVEFLEGDPDCPIITGRVYNGLCQPPYPLPDNQTVSTTKSNSSKGGGGFNEFRFEDKKGEEQIFLHAEKNIDLRIKNNRFETVVNDRHLVVDNDKFEHIKNDRNELIDNDHKEHIKNDRNLTVDGKDAVLVKKTKSLTVNDDVTEVYKKNQSTEIADDLYIKATNICIEASDNITIKVGDSFIAIESSGIKIGTKGDIALDATGGISCKAMKDIELEATMNVKIKGTAGLTTETPAMAEHKGTKITVNGSGMCEIKGGLVKIN